MPHCRGCPPFQKGEGLPYKGQPQGSQRRWPWERTATWDRFLEAAAGEHPGYSPRPLTWSKVT